jgi:Protein of unknown function (DUF1592)/Protein of unknown function (DUF1588)/Protein of unknown function (DUF1585)/Protein of unknown function (DUF1587)/Protein of unknown function (DUF1595)/Planctomycete cytochrome C
MKRRIATVLLLLSRAAFAEDATVPAPARAFLKAHCAECHDAETKKGGLDLDALPAQLDDAANEARWTLVFDRVQWGEMPPKKKPRPDAEEVALFVRSLGGFLSAHDAARHASGGRVPWRRLNRVEYENTVHDLLAIDIPLAGLLPEDGSADGFDNVSEGLRLSASQIEAYLTAADRALDAALNLGPRPEFRKRRFDYLELPQIREQLAKPHGFREKNGESYQQVYRALPDALAIFVNETWGGTTLRESRAEATGIYKVRLAAYAYQSRNRPTVVAKLMITDWTNERLAAAFDLPAGRPRIAEVTLRLNEGELLYLSAAGCGIAPDGTPVQAVGAEKFAGPGMAIQWVEIEGPLAESWPPAGVHRVFGDLPLRPKPKPDSHGRAYEVVAIKPGEAADRRIADFVRRAFRRPVAEEDTARFRQLAREALADGATLETALRRVIKAVLVSPEFLFLRENPGRLDDYALASRLAYFLWSAPPDDELLRRAERGELHAPAPLHAETERLLASPKAAAFTKNFCGQWLGLREIDATTPDPSLYPEFDLLLRDAMVGETESFFEELLHRNEPVAALIDSDFAMLNRRLAEHYGIPGVVGEQFRRVTLPAGSHRGGLLTQAAILKVTANGTLSSPVVRGAWVTKHLLGRTLPPPPADAGALEPDTRGATTIRDQLAKHRRSERCAACHQYLDPPGFALENFDAIGGWREFYRSQVKGSPVADPLTHLNLAYRQGLPVDASGQLADGRTFDDIDGLKKLLLDQRETVARSVVNNLVTYATGAGISFSDREAVAAILQRTKDDGYRLRTLVHEVVQSPLFQSK